MKRLDLGCGNKVREGFIGVDRLPLPGVQVVHDLNIFPYPFRDSEIDEIWMDNVLEHVKDPVRAMEEVFRISRNRAEVTVSVPFFRSAYAFIDPTHKNFFSAHWFAYFDPRHVFCERYAYSSARFLVRRIQFDRERQETGCLGLLRRVVVRWAEKDPWFYEQRVSHVYPLDSLTFYLTVMKEQDDNRASA